MGKILATLLLGVIWACVVTLVIHSFPVDWQVPVVGGMVYLLSRTPPANTRKEG